MKRRPPGFTLIEIMMVVSIIALLAAVAMPAFQRARIRSQAGRFLNDLRVVNCAFELYRFENKRWPSERGPRTIPPRMSPYLGDFPFLSPTPIGGVWDWDRGTFGIAAGISVDGPGFTDAQMAELIDARIDDGDLSAGAFRQTAGAIFTSILEQ